MLQLINLFHHKHKIVYIVDETQEQAKKSHGKGETEEKEDEQQESDTGDTVDIPAAEESGSSVDDEGAQDEENDYRHWEPGQKRFNIFITKKQWDKIKPKHDMNKLRSPWTDILAYLDVCVLENKDLKVEESDQMMEGEKIIMDKTANTIIGKSPFTRVFQLQRDQAECDVLSDDAVGTKKTLPLSWFY